MSSASRDHPLTAWRHEHKLSQKDLARLIGGISNITVSRIERRRVWPSRYVKTRLHQLSNGALAGVFR